MKAAAGAAVSPCRIAAELSLALPSQLLLSLHHERAEFA
jgi:hypothetical protein